MRAGLPIVATDVGGVAEMMKDGEQGFLTRRGDAEQLRDRIQCLVDSPTCEQRWAPVREQSLQRISRWKPAFAKHVALYAGALQRRTKKQRLKRSRRPEGNAGFRICNGRSPAASYCCQTLT